LSILPLYFGAENPVVGEDPNFPTGRPFAQANEVDVSVELLPLLHKDVQVKSVELKQPKIELVRNARGVWNYSSLGHPPAEAPAQKRPQPAGQPASTSQAFSLADLKITDGQLALTDYQKRQPRAVYDHVDLRLVGYAPDRAFDFEAAAHLPGK